MMSKNFVKFISGQIFLILFFGCVSVFAQTTEFSYQGFLKDANASANGNFDFEFRFYYVAAGGNVVSTQQKLNVAVENGVFSVVLDFAPLLLLTENAVGGANDYFLETAVRPSGGSGAFTTLAPRSKLLSTPLATISNYSSNAINSSQLGGIAANQYVQTNDPRLSNPRNPTPGSTNYIQNSTQPTPGNFNIIGDGTSNTMLANVISANNQYNLGNARILSNSGTNNFFAGVGSGQSNTGGTDNSFFGNNAGNSNTNGNRNSFYGRNSGSNNTTGDQNSFFGFQAGISNTSANGNSFFGTNAGRSNTTAHNNSFFGYLSGQANTTGNSNAFFGSATGEDNTTGSQNSFFGFNVGQNNTTGLANSFFGNAAGQNNLTGNFNSFFGHIAGRDNTLGSFNTFIGTFAGLRNTIGGGNTFIGMDSGSITTDGRDNTFIGFFSGRNNTTGSSNTAIGYKANFGSNDLTNASAIGNLAFVDVGCNDCLVLGSVFGKNDATASVKVGIGTTIPLDRLHVDGRIRVETLGTGGTTTLCLNASNQISNCSSSLRYKTDFVKFDSGLKLVKRLQPISFNWKDGAIRDLGLGAEDVEKIEPLLVTYNEKGEVEGVKYDRIGVVLLNAVKEQQIQIEKQKSEIDELKKALETIREQLKTFDNSDKSKSVVEKTENQMNNEEIK